MSLRPAEIASVPATTAQVAAAAFPKGCPVMRMRDELGAIYDDQLFASLYPVRGQPAHSPWRLALVTVLQFAEGLPDRQAANAVRGRIDWKYALGLELADPGFDHSVLCEFRARLVAGGLEQTLRSRSCPRTWCRSVILRHPWAGWASVGQVATAGRLTGVASSMGASVSRVI